LRDSATDLRISRKAFSACSGLLDEFVYLLAKFCGSRAKNPALSHYRFSLKLQSL
jgi:hypothetical protein